MLILLQHAALVAFIQQHVDLLLGVDVLVASGGQTEQFKQQKTASVQEVNEPCEEGQRPAHGVIRVQGRLLGKLQRQGLGHQFPQNHLQDRQDDQHYNGGYGIGHHGIHAAKPFKQGEQVGGQFHLAVRTQNQAGNGNAELAGRNVAVQFLRVFQNPQQMGSHLAAAFRHLPDHVAAHAHRCEFCGNVKGVDQNQEKNNEDDKKNHVWRGCP